MPVTSRVVITGQVTGMETGYKTFGPLIMTHTTTTVAIGRVYDIATISTSAYVTVTVPSAASGVIVAIGSSTGSTAILRIATNLDAHTSTTTGLSIGYKAAAPYAVLPIKSTVTKLYLRAATAAVKNVELTFF